MSVIFIIVITLIYVFIIFVVGKVMWFRVGEFYHHDDKTALAVLLGVIWPATLFVLAAMTFGRKIHEGLEKNDKKRRKSI